MIAVAFRLGESRSCVHCPHYPIHPRSQRWDECPQPFRINTALSGQDQPARSVIGSERLTVRGENRVDDRRRVFNSRQRSQPTGQFSE